MASTAFDAGQGLLQLPPPAAQADVGESPVDDLDQFFAAAKLPAAARAALAQDVVATGAVSVQELSRGDWEQLPSWQGLKSMERRRVIQLVPGP